MTEALHDVTFRILSMSETRRDVCPAQYGPVSGVFIRGEILRDNVSCGEQVFVAPLGDCDPAGRHTYAAGSRAERLRGADVRCVDHNQPLLPAVRHGVAGRAQRQLAAPYA